MMLELTNDFHNTRTRVRIEGFPARLSLSRVERAQRKLCPHRDCTCGGLFHNPQRNRPLGDFLAIHWDGPSTLGGEPELVIALATD